MDSLADEQRDTTTENDNLVSQSAEVPRSINKLGRLGLQTVIVLAVTPFLILGVLVFIAFLWFGPSNDPTWHRFMINGWTTRAVSVSSLVLRFTISLQAGFGVAMLAGLALEQDGVPLSDAAAIAALRSGNANPLSLVFQTTFRARKLGLNHSILAILLFTTTSLLQLMSTALLSDLKLGTLYGFPQTSSLRYDFEYNMTALANKKSFMPIQPRSTTWSRNPTFYPVFGEMSSPIPPRDDVDDTGLLLRAFLPMSDSQQRETVRSYAGKAFVLDSRVACQAPHLQNLEMSWEPTSGSIFSMSGACTNTTSIPGLLTPGSPVPFGCASYFYSSGCTICQLQSSGSKSNISAGVLQSVFSDSSLYQTYPQNTLATTGIFGAAYLVFNWSMSGDQITWIIHNADQPLTPAFHHTSGAWSIWNVPNASDSTQALPYFTFSLCYSAFDLARLDVELYSDFNRTEPLPLYDAAEAKFDFVDVLNQLGNNASVQTPRDRGILTMKERPSWLPLVEDALPGGVQPWVQTFADMTGRTYSEHLIDHHMTGNYSSILSQGLMYAADTISNADAALIWLFSQIMMTNGSIAAAMSSLITVLATMAYYDQMPQFQTASEVEQVYFETVLFPQAYTGFAIVTSMIALHVVVILIILQLFLRHTRLTLIGSTWQSIAQMVVPLTESLLRDVSLKTDAEVTKKLSKDGRIMERVKLGLLRDGQRGGLRYGLVEHEIKKRPRPAR
ncbi:hypothetical protein SCUP234_11388 [Seiridium cupressi]